MNDDRFLYLLLDVTGDTVDDSPNGDYFWLSFDVDQSGSITPRVDVNYGLYPDLPSRMGRQYYLGPGEWTGLVNDASPSCCVASRTGTGASGQAHRTWTLRVLLSEVGIGALAGVALPSLRFGLRLASRTPAFAADSPPGFYRDFSALHRVVLAGGPDVAYPPGTAGPVMAGVGLIPAGSITGGRATTAPSFHPAVTNAAFGEVLNVIGNRDAVARLHEKGARRFRVLCRPPGGDFQPLRLIWTNYRWTGSSYALEGYAPDARDSYLLAFPGDQYSVRDLLFQIDTRRPPVVNGLHEFRVEFLDDHGAVVAGDGQTLTLFVDNRPPQVAVMSVSATSAATPSTPGRVVTVDPCSVVAVDPTKPVRVRYRAFDPEGNLRQYGLTASYGGSGTPPLTLLPAVTYPGPQAGNWAGVSDETLDCPVGFPPVTCAYQIKVWATARTTDGYGDRGQAEAAMNATFVRPDVVVPRPRPVAPRGAAVSDGDGHVTVPHLMPRELKK